MAKDLLKILVINRPWREGEKCVAVFDKYACMGYDLIIFPYREDKKNTEVVFFNRQHEYTFDKLFCIHIECDIDDWLYDFDLEGVTEQTFYDILDQQFEVSISNLTDIEK